MTFNDRIFNVKMIWRLNLINDTEKHTKKNTNTQYTVCHNVLCISHLSVIETKIKMEYTTRNKSLASKKS